MSKISVTVSGETGSGKSAIAGEIEIALKAIGVPVFVQERDTMVHADYMHWIDLYKPEVTIFEQNIPAQLPGPDQLALQKRSEHCPTCGLRMDVLWHIDAHSVPPRSAQGAANPDAVKMYADALDAANARIAELEARAWPTAQSKQEPELLATYRDIFAEITAKAIPVYAPTSDDPERVRHYIVPTGPIHRAAGKLNFQMFDGEAHLASAIKAIEQSRTSAIEECARICESGVWSKYAVHHSPTKSCAIAIRALSAPVVADRYDEPMAAISDCFGPSVPSTHSRCAKCGCETKSEEALINGEIWCHPCADGVALPSTQRDGAA